MRPPDAVILDLVLPDRHGTEVARELRAWTTAPIIVLSVVGDESEKVAALDAGQTTTSRSRSASTSCSRAYVRRCDAPSRREPVLDIGELRIDLEGREVTRAGERVQLTPHETTCSPARANEGKLLTHKTILA